MAKEKQIIIEKTSPESSFYKAFSKFQSEMKTVEKNRKVKYTTKKGPVEFSYADLTKIWDAMRKTLTNNGLSIMQSIKHKDGYPFLETKLFHIEGHIEESTLKLECLGSDIKGMGGAITYWKRYAISAILGIVSDDDVDSIGEDEGESSFEKEISPKQLNLLKELLKDNDALKETICSLYGELNKIPESNFQKAYDTIKNEAIKYKTIAFLRRFGMDEKRTEYHKYIEFLANDKNKTFEEILENAVLNEKRFTSSFNDWKVKGSLHAEV